MNVRLLIPVLAILCLIIATAGCTGAPAAPAPAATPVPQPAAAGGTTTTPDSASLVPGPVDTLGNARSITVNIEKDYLGTIHATFQGGAGLGLVRKIVVTVNRADGQVKTTEVGIKLDDAATLEGTKQTDRVMIFATLNDGKTYKIFDDLVAYKPRPQ
jgi:hypothetical protein